MIKNIRISEFLPIQMVTKETGKVFAWVHLPMED
jgi:hypothetical protein